jgi:hypothetical protein
MTAKFIILINNNNANKENYINSSNKHNNNNNNLGQIYCLPTCQRAPHLLHIKYGQLELPRSTVRKKRIIIICTIYFFKGTVVVPLPALCFI